MSSKADDNSKGTVAFVEALQAAVQRADKSGDDFNVRVREANERYSGKGARKAQVTLSARSAEQTRDERGPSLRVTCPSRSVAAVEIPSGMGAEWVEFYLTRPRADGVPETRWIGVSKYKDGDGTWKVTFTTERFARTPNDPLILHAEVFGKANRLIATAAVAVVE